MKEQGTQEIKPFLRVLATDLEGHKPIVHALTKVRGVSFSLANALCTILNIPKTQKAGLITAEEAKKMEEVVKGGQSLPKWMFNRRSDFDTGEDRHVTGADLRLALEFDVKRLKRMRSYRGMRHSMGQPVRGQRTRSHFRRGRAIGVMKTKVAKVAAASKEADAKKK